MTLKIGALFAGYGGLDLATEMVLPAQLAWVSEIETAPTKILAHHYPHIPNHGDVTKIDWNKVEPVDIITGGSPCQDLSHAGRRAGMKTGTRSGLWASMCDAIETIKPRLVIWENVQGALSGEASIGDVESCEFCVDSTGGGNMRALGRVLGDLAEIGYHAAWTGLRAADIGAPHPRFRVFVLAWPATDTRGEGWGVARFPTASETQGGWASTVDSGRDRTPIDLLPTPRATDGTKGGPNQRGSKGDLMLPSAVQGLFQERVDLVENITAGGVLPGVDLDQSGEVADSFWAEFDSHTPNISEENGSLPTGAWSQNGNDLLFPTPTTQDAKNSGSVSQRNRNTPPLNTVVTLLPTPAVNDMGADKTIEWWDELAARQKSADGKPAPHGKSLHIEVLKMLLPTPTSERYDGRKSEAFAEGRHTIHEIMSRNRWGDYAAAVARWEALTRPAPAPQTPTGKNGKHRLSAAFVEWMMGLPDGWVTNPAIGISRNNQLKALGNGVVPQQAAWAIRHLLTIRDQALKEQL